MLIIDMWWIAIVALFRRFLRFARRKYVSLRYGDLTEHVVGTAGDGVAAEIEYVDKKGRLIGFWAYGYWHPDYPYRG